MKCEKCGLELSERVYYIHRDICKGKAESEAMSKTEIMDKLDNRGIKYNPRDKKEILEKLLEAE